MKEETCSCTYSVICLAFDSRARGLDLEATLHEGSKVTQLRRMNIETEISLKNDAIKQRNLLSSMPDLEHEIIATSKLLQQLKFEQSKLQTQSRESAFDDILNTASSKLTEINETFDKITEKNALALHSHS